MRRSLIPTILFCAIWTIVGCKKASNTEANDKELLSLKAKCREDGERVRAEWKNTYYQDTFSDEPEYAYNQSLKTCLWLGEYRGPSFDRDKSGKIVPVQTHVKFILDVYTNQTLIEFTEHGIEQIGEISDTDFKRKKAELFNSR